MRETVRAARARGVAIGAHPSYPDLIGFGRRELRLDAQEIRRHVAIQVGALKEICGNETARLTHVKPHGALYNRAASDPTAARAVIEGMREIDSTLVLLGLAGSEMQQAARQMGIAFASEAFVDRAYGNDSRLIPRERPGAVIEDVTDAVNQATRIVKEQTLRTREGTDIPVVARSLCVHGDNPRALALLGALRQGLESAGIQIEPFAS
jgi:UPF0271 protein